MTPSIITIVISWIGLPKFDSVARAARAENRVCVCVCVYKLDTKDRSRTAARDQTQNF